MQCFLRKGVANNHNLRHSHRIVHRTDVLQSSASSLPKPQLGHHIPPSLHHFHSSRWRSLSTIVRGAFNSRNAFLRNSGARVFFRRQSFNFDRDYDFNRRGWRSWFHRLSADNMLFGLIGANVAIFLLWRIADKRFMINNFTISLDNLKSGRLHTLITNAFSHVDTWHIISNMIGLYFFGLNVGRNFGPEFLLKLYLAGALGGSVFYLMHQAYKAQTSKDWRAMVAQKELALGASGAVNAVMLLDIFLFPKATLYLDFFIPVPAILLGIFLIGKDMLRIIEGDSQISGAAHLGGVAVAAIAWARVRRGRF